MVGAQIIVPRLTMFLSSLCIFIFVYFIGCPLFSEDRFLHLAGENDNKKPPNGCPEKTNKKVKYRRKFLIQQDVNIMLFLELISNLDYSLWACTHTATSVYYTDRNGV